MNLKGAVVFIIAIVALYPASSSASIAQTTFVIPKAVQTVLNGITASDRGSFLLSQGLDEKLEEEFPANISPETEVMVRVFAKVFGIPSYVAPVTVIRQPGQSWNDALQEGTVSAPPAPDDPQMQPMFMYCQYKTPRFDLTWWSGNSVIPVDYFRVEKESGGGWTLWHEGGQECVVTSGNHSGIDYRVKAFNHWGESDWVTVTLAADCISFGGGGGGGID